VKEKKIFIPAFFIVIAIAFLTGCAMIDTSAIKSGNYGPAFFPAICASMLLFCSVLEFSKAFKNDRLGSSTNEGINPRLLFLFGLGFLMPILLWAVGFIPTGLVGIFILCILIKIPWTKGLPFSIILTTVIYLLFNVALSVQLPRGLFF
jgi:hypothetical protein